MMQSQPGSDQQPEGTPPGRRRAPSPGPTPDRSTPGGRGPVRPRPGLIPAGHLFGVPVYFTASWLLLSLVLIAGYGPLLGSGPGGPAPYLLGLSVVVCLALTVLAHEVAHALVARHYRVGVRSITLELLGGATEMDAEAPTPRAEAAIALAGPAMSAVIAAAFAALLLVTKPGTLPGELVFQMTGTNALVAVFNALPGLPLDGGRALRAGVWRITHDEYRADLIAGRCGQVIAAITFAGALAYIRLVRNANLIGMVLLLMVAATLWTGANAAIAGGALRRRLPQIRAGSLARPIHIVSTGTPLSEALRRRDEAALAGPAAGGPPVIGVANSDGRVIALVSSARAAAIPLERRPWVEVDAASAALAPGQRVEASATGVDVLAAARDYPHGDLLVTVGEDVVGVVGAADIVATLRGRQRPPGGRVADGRAAGRRPGGEQGA